MRDKKNDLQDCDYVRGKWPSFLHAYGISILIRLFQTFQTILPINYNQKSDMILSVDYDVPHSSSRLLASHLTCSRTDNKQIVNAVFHFVTFLWISFAFQYGLDFLLSKSNGLDSKIVVWMQFRLVFNSCRNPLQANNNRRFFCVLFKVFFMDT